MNRLSNVFYVLLGAVAVGAVVAVLAVVGALPDEGRAHHHHADCRRTAVRQHSGLARVRAHERRRHLPEGLRQRGLRLARGGDGALPFDGQGGGKAASGSGFVIDTAGHIVTNDHVVEDANKFTVRFGEEGDPIPAKLVGEGPLERPRGPLDRTESRQGGSSRSISASRGVRAARPRSPSAARLACRAPSRLASSPRCTARSRRPTASRSRARCRPTPPSTPATRAARCSTRPGA